MFYIYVYVYTIGTLETIASVVKILLHNNHNDAWALN